MARWTDLEEIGIPGIKRRKSDRKRYGVTSNPVEGADALKEEFFEGVSLPVDELNDLISYMLNNENDSSIFVLIGLAVLAGLRRGEICGLRWGDIDWESRRIHIVRQRAQVRGDKNGWTILTPKGGSENGRTAGERKERWAVMPEKLSEILKIAMRQQEAYSGRKVETDDYVYRTKANLVEGYLSNPEKLSLSVNSFQNRCNKMRVRAGKAPITKFRLHDLRHTHVSICLNHDVNPFMVAASVGHVFSTKEMGVTGRVYWHDDGNRKEMAECLDRLIDVEIKVPEEETELMTPKKRASNRRNLRNDEI